MTLLSVCFSGLLIKAGFSLAYPKWQKSSLKQARRQHLRQSRNTIASMEQEKQLPTHWSTTVPSPIRLAAVCLPGSSGPNRKL